MYSINNSRADDTILILHDIATNVTALGFNLENLSERKSLRKNESYNYSLESLKNIKQLLGQANLQLRSASNPPKLLSPSRLLLEIINVYKHRLENSQIKITVQSDLNSRFKCLLPKQKFQQIFLNLIVNAIEAHEQSPSPPRTKKQIHLQLKPVIQHEDGQQYLEIICRDNSSGIPADKVNNIFAQGFTTKLKGNGLGLYQVKKLVEQEFAGNIRVITSEGIGTEFIVKLKITI